MQIRSVGIDLSKTTFHLVALGAGGKVLVRKKFTQKQLLAFTANMQTSLIGLEAAPEPTFSAAPVGACSHCGDQNGVALLRLGKGAGAASASRDTPKRGRACQKRTSQLHGAKHLGDTREAPAISGFSKGRASHVSADGHVALVASALLLPSASLSQRWHRRSFSPFSYQSFWRTAYFVHHISLGIPDDA